MIHAALIDTEIPRQKDWLERVPSHNELNITLNSGFVSRVSLPRDMSRNDVDEIIASLQSWRDGLNLHQRPGE